MKKILFLLFAAAAFAACNDDGEPKVRYATTNDGIENGYLQGANLHFYGTSTVTDAKGGTFHRRKPGSNSQAARKVSPLYAQNASRPICRAWKCGSKRSPTPRKGDKSLNFVREEIIPSALKENNEGGGSSYQPVERYKITNLTGAIDGVDCRVSFTCAGVFQVIYEGRLIIKKNKYPRTMKPEYKPFVDELIELCIKEDIGDGDHTSLACIPADEHGRMRLLCKQEGTIAGIEIAQLVLQRLDPEMKFEQILHDGDRVAPGDVAFYVSGRLRSLLQAERILLNIMQRMSGVATRPPFTSSGWRDFVPSVLDTRKTTPGMRVLDKMAVKIGGGENHRMGLFDMVLLKDNHIDFAGGIRPAIEGVRDTSRPKARRSPSSARSARWKTSTRCSPRAASTASCSTTSPPK